MSFFLVSMFQMCYMPCLESVINNPAPSFLQQNQYLVLAQYHSHVLNYFAQLVGSQLCAQCLLFLTEICNTVSLKDYRAARYLWNWTTPKDHFPTLHGSKAVFKYEGERYCASTFHTMWKLRVSFTHRVLQGTDLLVDPWGVMFSNTYPGAGIGKNAEGFWAPVESYTGLL